MSEPISTPFAERKWLSMRQLAEYLDLTTNAAHKWLREQRRKGRIRPGHRGRALMVLRVEVDRVISPPRAELKAVG